jgi:hypothetical protein
MISKARLLTVAEVTAIATQAEAAGNEPVYQLANEVLAGRARVRSGTITAESLVSATDGHGRVRIAWEDNEAFLDVDVAAGLGQSMLEAAAAARIDALFVAVATKNLGMSYAEVGPLLKAIRAARVIPTPQ